MPRTGKKGEYYSHPTSFGIFRDKASSPGNTTLTADLAAGSTNLAVAAITNFSDQDWARIGLNEDVEIIRVQGAPSGTTIVSAWATGKKHSNADAVVEQSLTDLGYITDAGVKITRGGQSTGVGSATRGLMVGYLDGHQELMFDVSLECDNLENLATSLGMLESDITGSGSTAAPWALFEDGSKYREQDDSCFLLQGVRKDGLIKSTYFMGVELDWAKVTQAFQRGTLSEIPISGRCTSGILWTLNS